MVAQEFGGNLWKVSGVLEQEEISVMGPQTACVHHYKTVFYSVLKTKLLPCWDHAGDRWVVGWLLAGLGSTRKVA